MRPGRHAVILANGNPGCNGNHANSPDLYAAWSMWHGGDFYEVTPEGKVVWRHEDPAHHHDAQWLPNGNLLYAACAPVPEGYAQRVPGGTTHGPDERMHGDVIREVDRAGRIVWEWKAWEHLDPAAFPIHPGFGRYHWPLVNGLGVMDDGDLGAIACGAALAAVMSQSRLVERSFYPDAVLLQTVPVVAVAPLIVLWFGYNELSVVVISFIMALFPIVNNTLPGLRSTSRTLVELFALHSDSRLVAFWKLRLPSALPSIFAGLRISAGLSVIGAIVFPQGRMYTALLFAEVIAATLPGFVFFLAVTAAGHRLLAHWHASAGER